MKKKKIKERADKVLAAMQYIDGQDFYIDSVRLAAFFGFSVEEKMLLEHEEGSVNVSDYGAEKYIVINYNRHLENKRFTVACELAYYLLHYTLDNETFVHCLNEKSQTPEEHDAAYMATCLLMPEKSFAAIYRALKKELSYTNLISALQGYFCVPNGIVERRIFYEVFTNV